MDSFVKDFIMDSLHELLKMEFLVRNHKNGFVCMEPEQWIRLYAILTIDSLYWILIMECLVRSHHNGFVCKELEN